MPTAFDPYRKWLGIPPEEQPPHFYRLLGIPIFEDDSDVIENAAHRQMGYVRTFQTGKHADVSQQLLNELAAAKVCLLSPERKAAYDEELHQQLADTGAAADAVMTVAARRSPGHPPAAVTNWAGTTPEGNREPKGDLPDFDDSSSASLGTHHGSARLRHLARRQLLVVPMLFGTLGVVAVTVIVALVAVNFRRKLPPQTPPTKSAEAESNGFGNPLDPLGAAPPSATRPDGTPEVVNSEDHVRRQLAMAREAMSDRNLSRARMLLQSAGVPQRNDALRAETERLDALLAYLVEFQKAVRRGSDVVRRRIRDDSEKPLRAPPPFAPETYEFRECDHDRVTYTVNGAPFTSSLDRLPPKPAAVLAFLGLGQEDPFVRIYAASFLLLDRAGDPKENRRLAVALWLEAARRDGEPNRYLAEEFQLSLAAPHEAEDQPAPMDR